MKTILLAATLAFSFNAYSATPEDFIGYFKLVKTKLGSCDDTLQGYFTERGSGGGDLRLGSFYFTEVNMGQLVMDDELMKIVSISYTNNEGAYSKTRMLTKATGETSVTVNRAVLNGNRLTLKSTTTMDSPTEPAFSFSTHCTYRRTAPPVDPSIQE